MICLVDPKTFPFIERPSEDALNEAIEMLKFQGVVYPDKPNELTTLGYTIAKIPVEVSVAKVIFNLHFHFERSRCSFLVAFRIKQKSCSHLLQGFRYKVPSLAGHSGSFLYINSLKFTCRELDIIKRRESLASRLGDPFTLINVFREWVELKVGSGGARRWCHENGIDEHRLYEISKLRHQYR